VKAITTSQSVQNYQIGLAGDASPITLNFTEAPGFFEAEGQVTLGVANLGSIAGNFGVEKVSDGGTGSYLAIGVSGVNLAIGAADTNFTIAGANFGLLIHK